MIEARTPGPWAVDTFGHVWYVVNTKTGRKKRIGLVYQPRSHQRINYFDRAMDEATSRNQAINQKEQKP